eukprot:6749473-Pyramimonas_sp.AAC.2
MHPRHSVLGALEQYFGYKVFRHRQQNVIENVLNGKDCLLVAATGALVDTGMEREVPMLPAPTAGKRAGGRRDFAAHQSNEGSPPPLGIGGTDARQRLTCVHPGCLAVTLQAERGTDVDAFNGMYSLVYMSPEFATSRHEQLRALHARHGVCLLAIDEAHCVSEWGHDFRKEYRHLGALRTALPGVPLLAVTATATSQVRGDIRRSLRMSPNCAEVVESFDRPNLHYRVKLKQGAIADQLQVSHCDTLAREAV